MDATKQFSRKKYLNLETYRRNGKRIRTPVWFVLDEDRLFFRTLANSGKVKRIRNNPKVNIAPCRVDGTTVGDWQPAHAIKVIDEEKIHNTDVLMSKKYGLLHKIYAYRSARQGLKKVILEIKILN